MRRAVIATAATVVGLVALLDYRSSFSSSARRKVSIGGATTAPTTPSTPSSAAPSTIAPGHDTSPTTSAIPKSSSQTYTGEDITYRYGDIEVRVVVADGRITAIDIPEESATDPRSQSINSQAVPILTREALAAGGANIDVVSGATYTSDAFAQSLESAVQKEQK